MGQFYYIAVVVVVVIPTVKVNQVLYKYEVRLISSATADSAERNRIL